MVVTADPTLSVFTSTFHVVPLTSNTERAWETDAPVSLRDGTASAAQCHLVSVVDRDQVVAMSSDNVGAVVLAQVRW